MDILNIVQENPDKPAFYIVDLGIIKELYDQWTRLLPNIKPYYAIKCNSNPRILQVLDDLNVNFDCASQFEIQTILDLTQDPDRIIFANPCKVQGHIQYAKENGVHLMTFDCVEELRKIRTHFPKARLVLRLAVDDSHSLMKFSKKFGCPMVRGQKPQQLTTESTFGGDLQSLTEGVHSSLENVETLLREAQSMNMNVVGFSFHVGSMCLSPETYYQALFDVRTAYDIATKMGHSIDLVDIGGGFSSSHRFAEAASEINRGLQLFADCPNIRFIAEPGRYFVEISHTLVLQIIGKKEGKDGMIYTLNESVYNSFNCTIFDCHVPTILPLVVREGALRSTRIYGYSCDSMDVLVDDVMMPPMEVGDRVYVENFGAYTYSAASSFNGFQATEHFIYRGG